jgi:hypothetical protein
MNRPAVLALAILAAGSAAAPMAQAAPKPVKKTYTATAPMPDPTNFAGQGYSVCAQNVPQSFHTEEFKVPAAGTVKVELVGYQGDWDLLLMDGKDQEMAYGGAIEPGAPEIAQVKFKKAAVVKIVACNWAGGPTGQVTYTFTYK